MRRVRVAIPDGFGLWSASLQEKWMKDNVGPPTTDPCGHCGHNRAAHGNGLGSCIGYHCLCSRFIKETPQIRQIKAMRQAIEVVIEMLEEWPTDDEKGRRNIRVGSPTLAEKGDMVTQLRKALATR